MAKSLETQTANRLAHEALGAISAAARGVNVQRLIKSFRSGIKRYTAVVTCFFSVMPQTIETDISLSDGQRTEELGVIWVNQSDYVAGIRDDSVARFLNRLQSRGFQSRSNLGQNVVNRYKLPSA